MTANTQLLTGWGRTAPSRADVRPADTVEAVREAVLQAGPRGVLARGLGRSYGDAAQNAGGAVLDTSRLTGAVRVDGEARTVTTPAGTSYETLLRAVLPHGLVLPVLPGTRFVTLGGAVAADVHGKNHCREGGLGHWLDEVVLLDGTGSVRRLTPTATPAAFWATVGGMGLTGVVLAATLRLLPVTTTSMRVSTRRAPDLDALLAAWEEPAVRDARYAVAWVDCATPGRALGRGVLTAADHAQAADLPPGRRAAPLRYDPPARLAAPNLPLGLVRPGTVRAFNAAWWAKAPTARDGQLASLTSFFHPLDGVRHWNRLYGPGGFLQYQLAVPPAATAVLERVARCLADARAAPFLGVLKRFGPADPAPLGFPAPGWSLAVDLPTGGEGLPRLLDHLDGLVAGAGGRVYLAKDARLARQHVTAMYPRLPEWRAARAEMDPRGVFYSDLDRRLGLR